MRKPHILQPEEKGQKNEQFQCHMLQVLQASASRRMRVSPKCGNRIFADRVETIHTKCHKRLVELLIAERKRAGIRQTELAKALGHSQTWIARMEAGGRRIDVVEFLILANRIGFNPAKAIRLLSRSL